MKTIFILVGFLFNSFSGECQLKPIALSKVYSSEVKALRCIDSVGNISSHCSLDLDGFSVRFYYVGFDKIRKVARLIGRVCIGNGDTCQGVSNISIYKGIKKMQTISNKEAIGMSTYDKKFLSNDGFFDLYFSISPLESLIFMGTGYFIREFTIFKIFR